MSIATIKGYKGIMTGKDKPPGHVYMIDESAKSGKSKKVLRKGKEKTYRE